jgi:hypothetical protein
MADFISLHREEWAALATGLEFSAMVAKAKVLFLPVVIVVLGLSLLIWLYRLEREREWSAFVLWLIFSSTILLSTFSTQKVSVQLVPAILNSKGLMQGLNVDQNQKKKKKEEEEDSSSSNKDQFLYIADASGISALLAIPDKIAILMFNFMDYRVLKKLAQHSNTIPLDNVACQDPRYLAGVAHMIVLSEVFSLTVEGNQPPANFMKKINAFETCYRNNFKGKTEWLVDFEFSGDRLWKAVKRGVIVGGWLGLLIGGPVGKVLGAKAGAVVGAITVIVTGATALVKPTGDRLDCQAFITNGYKPLLSDLANKCAAVMGKGYKTQEQIAAALACITKPNGKCEEFKNAILNKIERVKQMHDEMTGLGQSEWWGNLKDRVAVEVSELKAWWFSNTYMDFPLKFELLAKGQGIVLALLTGMFPFVAVLSVIPVGRHFINWPLLLNFMIAYFMVKMWIPLLFFIVVAAAHRLVGFAVGG